MKNSRVLLFLLAITAFRLWFCTYHELVADEAYYFLWSKHLDWSYYSKGPLIGWTIALGTFVFGDTVFGIRWLSVLLSAGTGWLLFRLGSRLWNPRVGFACLLVGALMPLYAIGSVLMTIDPLSVFLWVLAVHTFLNAVELNRWRDWLMTGFIVGLGFLAKFINALELLCFALILLMDPERRRLFFSWKFAGMLGVVALCTLPVILWNQNHGWITATHLQQRGQLNHAFQLRPKEMFQFVYMQGIVLSPLFFFGLIAATIVALQKWKTDFATRVALGLFLPVFGFYWILSWNDNGEANWTATSFIGGIPLLVVWALDLSERSILWRRIVAFAVVLAFIQTVAIHDTYWLHLPRKSDPGIRLRGWSDLGKKIQAIRNQHPEAILIGNKYQTSSLLSFYLPDRPTTFIPKRALLENQFSFWPSYPLTPKTTALLVTDSINEMPEVIPQQFRKVELVSDFWTEDRGRQLYRFQVYFLSEAH